ncbi:MAG: hypothetical protein PWQ62_1274 [Candidatus Methanomethylophilaceae archaeon]|nr:hypothetical protein [Candidatus Methanomethylophilaceae archaeon]
MDKIRVNADLYVKDVPGQLVAALEPISVMEGNIVGVVHHRDQIMNNRIGINVTFDLADSERLDRLLSVWKERDVHISRIGSVVETFPLDYLLIGDISPSWLETMLDRIRDSLGIESLDIRYSAVTNTGNRTALIKAKLTNKENLRKAEQLINEIVKERDILAVRGLGK